MRSLSEWYSFGLVIRYLLWSFPILCNGPRPCLVSFFRHPLAYISCRTRIDIG